MENEAIVNQTRLEDLKKAIEQYKGHNVIVKINGGGNEKGKIVDVRFPDYILMESKVNKKLPVFIGLGAVLAIRPD